MKKYLVLFIMLMAAVMLTSAAADSKSTVTPSGTYTYVLQEDGTAQIINYTGNYFRVSIPAYLDGICVTSISSNAFYQCKHLEGITLPETVVSIEGNPFIRNRYLTSISVSPANPVLASIDGVLFDKTEKRLVCYPIGRKEETYAIPQGIRIIGDHAFYNVSLLSSVTVPGTVTTIEDSAFEWCDSLTSITLPRSVTSVGNHAFSGCESIRRVSLPSTVTSIGNFAFSSCTSLTSIKIPDSVTSIGDHAFAECNSLTSITIPDNVISVGANPFATCAKLTEIIVSPSHPVLTVIDGVLFDKKEQRLICYPYACKTNSYTIPQGTQIIGGRAFYKCDFLASIAIPQSVVTIDSSAFYRCEALTTVTLPDTVTSIGYYAFAYGSSLKSVTLPDSVTFIDEQAFFNSNSVTFTVGPGSYAEQYCISEQRPYTYPDANDWLLN